MKVVQICSDNEVIYALCDDGTIWKRVIQSYAQTALKWVPIEGPVPLPPKVESNL